LLSFVLGGIFGVSESIIRDHLKNKGQDVVDTVYEGDSERMENVANRSFGFFRRAHFHAGGLGAVSLVVILMLMFLQASLILKKLTALALGLGAFGYSTFWMFIGLKAPGLGNIGEARESLAYMAIPSTILCILGLISVLFIIIKSTFFTQNTST
jgi:hypothetical protein